MFKNKLNENWEVIRNTTKIVWKIYCQHKDIDFEETSARVARLEAIRIFLASSSFHKFKVYQRDAKFGFLNGDLEEEVYIKQREGFILGNDKIIVCKLKKTLYGLKKAPRSWYYHLERYLQEQGFKKGSTNSNLYTKFGKQKLLRVVVYVDAITFRSNVESMNQGFALAMQHEFEMFVLSELKLFLGLQINQTKNGIFLSQTKYLKPIMKKYGMEYCKHVCTPMETRCNVSDNDDFPTVNQSK